MPDGIIKNSISEQEEINQINEEEYFAKIRKKNKKTLLRLTDEEKKRIAKYIVSLYKEALPNHNDLCDKLDNYDDVYRMKRDTRPGDDENTPNYRTPLSAVTTEIIHANIINVFFTPADIMRVIPTEEGDIPKVKKLDTFGNWSMKNEMDLFNKCDRLFHASTKNGEYPYMVHWVKEYGTEIKIETISDPANPGQVLLDPDTKEPLTQEKEEMKLLYNGPRLEIFSRKDYILPKNAMADKLNDWEMRRLRLISDTVNRYSEEGKFYDEAFKNIFFTVGSSGENQDNQSLNTEGETIPLAKDEKIYIEFYGRLRITTIKTDMLNEQDIKSLEELEDEFIAKVEIKSETLCEIRKNRFPLKMRPCGLDVLLPDDEGRIGGMGVVERMESVQKSYDALYNQYLYGTIQANSSIIFFEPTGNMRDEPIKIKTGWAYPTANAGGINVIKFPAPDISLRQMMEDVRNFAQLLWGLSDYSAGLESQIDPTAPAKKAEIVVAQGNVRLNAIIKRKNKTLKDIFKRWFLLYQANMPPNKFMRIAGNDPKSAWKFEPINMTDFALNSIPDFELTGNVLNANKTLEVQKALGIYNVLITNPFFMPQTQQGLQALYALTQWLLDKFDETGLSSFLPSPQGQYIHTPEEENARFLQGDKIEPDEKEDHIYHIRAHNQMMLDPTIPEEIRKNIIEHITLHIELFRKNVARQTILQTMGGQGGVERGTERAASAAEPIFSESTMERPEVGAGAGIQ